MRMIAELAVVWKAAYEAQALRLGGGWVERGLWMASIWDRTEINVRVQMFRGHRRGGRMYAVPRAGVVEFCESDMAEAAAHTVALLGPRPGR